MARGSKVNIKDNYVAASTAAQRTKDLNRLNSSSKTAGRAANLESKLKKAAAAKNPMGLKKMNLDKRAKKK
jgi:hypothetical protein